MCLLNKPDQRELAKVLGQGDRGGGGPAARAAEVNAGPVPLLASLEERQRWTGLFSKHTLVRISGYKSGAFAFFSAPLRLCVKNSAFPIHRGVKPLLPLQSGGDRGHRPTFSHPTTGRVYIRQT